MKRLFCFFFLTAMCGVSQAHVADHPSIHDTVAGIVERFQAEVQNDALKVITVPEVIKKLKPEELSILSEQHLNFTVNVPVILYILRPQDMKEQVFWLKKRGFKKTRLVVSTNEAKYAAYKKTFEAGNIGLGVNSLSGNGDHYFVAILPQDGQSEIVIDHVYPANFTTGQMQPDERVYLYWKKDTLTDIPDVLKGALLIRGDEDRRRSAKLINVYQTTKYPSSVKPDQVVLTWQGDPKTSQSIQWRAGIEVKHHLLRYREKQTIGDLAPWQEVTALSKPLVNHNTINDPVVYRQLVRLEGLQPGRSYEYQVGDGSRIGWTAIATFSTAPDEAIPFKFIYMGDAQNGLDTWGKMARESYAAEPDAAFYIMAGDLVNRGNERFDWDDFFYNAEGIFNHKQLIPAIGNHEDQGEHGPWMYLSLFDLPLNGPKNITPERAYSFNYSNALFVVLDSNVSPALQSAWLETQLKNSDATWKFAVYHHPAYSSKGKRENDALRLAWVKLFDKYHVDLALQGHDHAYLRTWPMHGDEKVESAAEGTIYIVSVSGTKMYPQDKFDYTEFGMDNVATYQLLDLQIDGTKLTYRAYDAEGKLRDEFIIEK